MIARMLRLAIGCALLAAALAGDATPAAAQDLIVYSQNLLRFGHGKRTATQCTAFGTQIQKVDVALIQELMVSATPCPGTAPLPGTYVWHALGPYGTSTYKEYYGFLYPSAPRVNGPTIAVVANRGASATQFMRPPQGVLFEVIPNGSTTPKYLWVANIHVVWGKTVGGRRQEAQNSAAFFATLATVNVPATGQPTSNIIIAGDWNLPPADPGFQGYAVANPVGTVQQTAQTSLTRTGALSQSYDHFVTSPTVTLTNMGTIGFPTLQQWRTDVSDHLGIQASVTLP